MIINNTKNENGITITSLVVTIILILILATISLTTITGSTGLLARTETTVSAYKQAEITEKVKLKLLDLNMSKLANEKESADLDDVLNLKNTDDEVIDSYELDDTVVLIIDKYECVIDKDLNIKSINIYNPAKLRKVTRPIKSYSLD